MTAPLPLGNPLRIPRPFSVLAALTILLLFTATAPAADYVPPRVSHVDGGAAYEPAGEVDWEEVAINLPLLSGDRIFSHPDSRIEIELGYDNFLRLGQETDLTFGRVGEKETELDLALGDVILRVNESSRFTVRTPHASVKIKKKGLYRVTVYEDGTARVAVRKGKAEVENAVRDRKVKTGEELFIEGPQSGLTQVAHSWRDDEFDDWSARRDAQFVSVRSTKYVGGYYAGVYDLDHHGDWRYVAGYGNLWFPRYSAGWAPYRIGRWAYYPRWGWTWISFEPWGWLPYHYGSWIYYAPYNRWCWYPRRFSRWSPALVNFYFGNGYVGWTPRGWRDDGRGNVTVINNNTTIINNGGATRNRPGRGLTVVNENDFGTRRPDRTHISQPDRTFVDSLRPGLPADLPQRTRRVNVRSTSAAPAAAAGPRVVDVTPQSGESPQATAPATSGRGWSGRGAGSTRTAGESAAPRSNLIQAEPARTTSTPSENASPDRRTRRAAPIGDASPDRRTRRAAPVGAERPSADRASPSPRVPNRSGSQAVTPAPSSSPSVAPPSRPSAPRRVTPRQSSPSRVKPPTSSPRRVQPRPSSPRSVSPRRSTPRRVTPQSSTPRRPPAPTRPARPKQNRKPPTM